MRRRLFLSLCFLQFFMVPSISAAAKDTMSREFLDLMQEQAAVKEKFYELKTKINRETSEQVKRRSFEESTTFFSILDRIQSENVSRVYLQLRLSPTEQYEAQSLHLYIDGISWGIFQFSQDLERSEDIYWYTIALNDVPHGLRELKFEISFLPQIKKVSVVYPTTQHLMSVGNETIFVSDRLEEVFIAMSLDHLSWNQAPHLTLQKWNPLVGNTP